MRFRKTETTPEKPEDSALHRRFERKVRLSWLALLAERIWEALLWPFLVVALFLVVSLVELWSLMSPLLHRVVLGAFGIGLLVSFLPLVRIKVPTRLEALRRLEKHANIKHRPATSYEDRLGATPPKETVALWAAHRPHGPLCPQGCDPARPRRCGARRRRRRARTPAGRVLAGGDCDTCLAQARCLGDAACLYRDCPHRARRRQRTGWRRRGELQSAVGA